MTALHLRPDALFDVSDDFSGQAVLFNSLHFAVAAAQAFPESPPEPLGASLRACLQHIVSSAPKPMTWSAIQAAMDRRLLSRLKEVFRIN